MKKLTVLLLVALFCGCPKPVPRPHPVQPTDTDKCHDACVKLRSLGCEEGDTVPKAYCNEDANPVGGKCSDGSPASDLTCELFCQVTQEKGHALKPSCILDKVQACGDIDRLCNEQ